MSEEKITKQAAAALTEEPATIKITEDKKHWLTGRAVTVTHSFFVKPPVLGQMIRIGKVLQGLPELRMGRPFMEATVTANKVVAEHGEDLVNLVAHVLSGKEPPSDRLRNLVRDNVDAKNLIAIWTMYITMMDVSNFTNSIVLMKNSDPTKTSPQDQRR